MKKLSQSEAKQAYAVIGESKTDVDAIVRYAGLSERSRTRLQMIKDYLFKNPEFQPDAGVAEAWHRLRTGKGTSEDMLLLKHEVAENWYRRHFDLDYWEAHRKANRKYNWEKVVDDK